jgi:hypothetical protein
MSPSRRSPRLARSILEQARRHARLRKTTAEPQGGSTRHEHDLIVAQLKIDLIAGVQASTITQRLWYHHLALSSDSTNHTLRV